MKYITGIGSRKCPTSIKSLIDEIAFRFISEGYVLRSGGADGADTFFEQAWDRNGGQKQIFLPWKGFNGSSSTLYDIPEAAFHTAERLHPNWPACSQGARRLHARNIQQLLGKNLDKPSDIVVCWTPKGEVVGGTATAINLALENGIPVLNLFNLDKDNFPWYNYLEDYHGTLCQCQKCYFEAQDRDLAIPPEDCPF